MSNKRSSPRPTAGQGSGSTSGPLVSALLVSSAVGYALFLLVGKGEIAWPPRELMSSLATVAGSLGLIGPIVLWSRRESSLGDLVWMSVGLALWTFNLIQVVEAGPSRVVWTAPVEARVLMTLALATFVAGWKGGHARWAWTWTGVTGALLGALWILLGLFSFLPDGWLSTSPGGSNVLPFAIRPR